MKKEQNRKTILIQMVLVAALSIFAGLFFLFSIKSLLLTEAKSDLLSLNQKFIRLIKEADESDTLSGQKQNKAIFPMEVSANEFDGQIYSYVLDESGNVIAASGDEASKVSAENGDYFGQFLYDISIENDAENMLERDGFAGKYKLLSGENYYIGIRSMNDNEGYVISVVPAGIIDTEIESIWSVAVIIIILTVVSVLLGIIYSVYKKRTYNRQMSKKGRPDSVTGLPHYLAHKLRAQQLIKAEKNKYAYVSFTIDKFYLISELSGKAYCDYLLKEIATSLSHLITEEETLARVHDDSFGMLLKYDDELKFRQRLIRMFKHAGDIPNTDNNFCNIAFRSGVCVTKRRTDIDIVIGQAKKARKNIGYGMIANINFYQATSPEQKLNEQIVQEAAKAFREKQFRVYLQPKYRLESEKMTGAEALIRWEHPSYGLLTPNVFQPLFEDNKLVIQLDLYVLDYVCKLIRDWMQARVQPVPISINLSARHLKNPDFIKELLKIIDLYQVPHHLIEFEFPENAVYDTMNELLEAMKQLQQLGFIISIDNFGAGLSSIQLLKELPIHILKIDKALIKDFEDVEFSDKDRTVVTHIIAYAKSMNMEVVAEGVETQGQKEILEAQSCDIIQGYYYQKPMPPHEFEKLLEA